MSDSSPETVLQRLKYLPDHVRLCLGFFSRFPVGLPRSTIEMSDASAAWPMTGLLIAVVPAFCLLSLGLAGANPLLASALTVAFMTALGGGLHEDGLADVADGMIGGGTRTSKLQIMKDSRIGTYGVVALVLTLILKVSALASIGESSIWLAVLAFLLVAVLSRAFAVWHWYDLLPARMDGLSHRVGRPNHPAFLLSGVTGLVAAILLMAIFKIAAILAIVAAIIAALLFTRACQRQLGGQTGDTIGAVQQISELALLVGLALFLAL